MVVKTQITRQRFGFKRYAWSVINQLRIRWSFPFSTGLCAFFHSLKLGMLVGDSERLIAAEPAKGDSPSAGERGFGFHVNDNYTHIQIVTHFPTVSKPDHQYDSFYHCKMLHAIPFVKLSSTTDALVGTAIQHVNHHPL